MTRRKKLSFTGMIPFNLTEINPVPELCIENGRKGSRIIVRFTVIWRAIFMMVFTL